MPTALSTVYRFAHRMLRGIGLYAHIKSRTPHGTDLQTDIARRLPGYKINRVFDVGANTGQSAVDYVRWPGVAAVDCFEPVPEVYKALVDRVQSPSVRCHNVALGDTETTATMEVPDDHSMSAIAETGAGETRVTTLDGFCNEQGITRIGLVKIDTEGYEMKVLAGAAEMLAASQIDFVQVEAGTSPHNETHASLVSLMGHLESHGYALFGIYEQVHEFKTGRANLRRINAVFISPKLM